MNPRAGGAEALTFENARRLVAAGDSVEWFSAGYRGCAPQEVCDGVHIVRAGRTWSVHLNAYLRYRGTLARRFDVVVDEINTIPFFTPLWARVPVVLYMHQLAREVWWYESRFPISAIGYLAEPLYLRAYKRVHAIALSNSTRDDLRKVGLGGEIKVIAPGVESVADVGPTRRRRPRFVFVGRLTPSKRVLDVIKAFAIFRSEVPGAELHVIGEGPARYTRRIEAAARSLGVREGVTLLGRISTRQKHEEMAAAQMLLMTSVREGWGLVVSEANALGTPAIGYDVPGLRDSIRNNVTGLLVRARPDVLAEAMVRLWNDEALWMRLSSEARSWSAGLSFEKMAAQFRHELLFVISRQGEVDPTAVGVSH